MSNIRKVILIITGILLIVFCYFYIDYRLIKVDAYNAMEFEKRISSAIKAGGVVDMREMTPFQWDKAYYFPAYTPPVRMYERTGARWTNCRTFIGYILFNDAEKELLNDGFYALVFVHKGKVVCHYTGAADKFGFGSEMPAGIEAEDSIFRVDYQDMGGNDTYPLLRIHNRAYGK